MRQQSIKWNSQLPASEAKIDNLINDSFGTFEALPVEGIVKLTALEFLYLVKSCANRKIS